MSYSSIWAFADDVCLQRHKLIVDLDNLIAGRGRHIRGLDIQRPQMERSEWPKGKGDDEEDKGEDEVSSATWWAWRSHRDISFVKSTLLVHADGDK